MPDLRQSAAGAQLVDRVRHVRKCVAVLFPVGIGRFVAPFEKILHRSGMHACVAKGAHAHFITPQGQRPELEGRCGGEQAGHKPRTTLDLSVDAKDRRNERRQIAPASDVQPSHRDDRHRFNVGDATRDVNGVEVIRVERKPGDRMALYGWR
jgi:hypothetical protein